MEAIGYIRVSTEEQARKGVSLKAQKLRIALWCKGADHELLKVYKDEGLSGGKAHNRPGLQAALDDACKRKAALVVCKLDRLARSVRDTIDISDRLRKADADLVSVHERIDTTSAAGKMVFNMLAVLAQFEREQIGERVRAAMAYKRKKGECLGTPPYGYRVSGNGRTLEREPKEQGRLLLIRALRQKGLSLRAIRSELSKQGIPNRKGNTVWRLNTLGELVKRTA